MKKYSFLDEGTLIDGAGFTSLRKAQNQKTLEISRMSNDLILKQNPNNKKLQKLSTINDQQKRIKYIQKNIVGQKSRLSNIGNEFVPLPFYRANKQMKYSDQAQKLRSQTATIFLQNMN